MRILALGLLLLSGCATILKGSRETLTVDSEPRGARVYLNGNPIGHTPLESKVASKDDYTFEFRQDGYETRTATIGHFVGAGWIVADILLPFLLINIIVDAATGDWFYLDQDHLMVTLEPIAHPAPTPPVRPIAPPVPAPGT